MNIEPCMWCDSPEGVSAIKDYQEYKPYVFCHNCGATGPVKDTLDEAIAAWNKVARIVRDAKE